MSQSNYISSSQLAIPAPPSPVSSVVTNEHDDVNSHSRRTSHQSSSSSTSKDSIQSLHIASVPAFTLSPAFSSSHSAISRAPASPPSSRSAASSRYQSPEASPNSVAASYRVHRRDLDADGSESERGSSLRTGEVVGLMRTLQLNASPTGSMVTEHGLEDGEIREQPHLSPQARSPPAIRSPERQRQREQSFGGALPSSPEVLPSSVPDNSTGNASRLDSNANATSTDNTPIACLTPVPKSGATGTSVLSTSAAATHPNTSSTNSGLSTMPTSSTLSSITSSSSFHTASSSSSIPTSISNSGSANDLSVCNSTSYQNIPAAGISQALDETQFAPGGHSDQTLSPGLSQQSAQSTSPAKVPETGTIDLETLDKNGSNAAPVLTLNPHAPAHIPSSGASASEGGSYNDVEDEAKSPNVYINGLPPHYPEDQLFELASPFGEIRSVRSFTRHVGEKESGYGFVLFATVESADKCIQSLRRFRNLHPTFSKQSHKIPGMPYNQNQPFSQGGWTQEKDNGPSLAHGAEHAFGASAGKAQTGEVTFKTKMERLQDPNSTNLYIEGLPLSIDEPSLAALVSPHRIKSSRFFQTRLSNPPRIIAFVRLETRHGAQEVIERLHGRMVRGWNDTGSRISVRFADTSEQRELRRTERTVREDDTTPSRLTIAQAALLNLRGRDQLRPQVTGHTAPPIGSGRAPHGSAPTANQVYNEFSSNAHDIASAAAGGYRGSASDLTSAAQLLAGVNSGPHRGANVSPYQQNSALPSVSGPTAQDLTPAMAALLDSLRGNGTPWTGRDDRYSSQRPPHSLPTLRNAHPVLGDVDLNLAYDSRYQDRAGGGVAQTRSGYTPAEELILNAHAAQRRKGSAHGSDQSVYHHGGQGDDNADLNVGVRGYRTQAATVSLPQQQQASYYPSSGTLPAVMESETDYEVESHQRYPQSQLNGARARTAAQSRGADSRERDSGHFQAQPYDRQGSGNHSQAPSQHNYHTGGNGHYQQAHVRSTTLPPSSTPSTAQSRHYQHNSMSIPKSRNITNDIMRTTSQSIPQHSKHRSTNSNSSIITNDNKNNTQLYSDASNIRTHNGATYTDPASGNHYRHNLSKAGEQLDYKKSYDEVYTSTAHSFRDPDVYDVPQTSPPMVSPALSYTSRGSTATLSPSTPYVGSFPQGSGGEYQGRAIETEAGDGR